MVRGADMHPEATPGLVEGGNEFYTVAGAEAVRDVLPRFEHGQALVGVTRKTFKCLPAPSEAALLLHDYLVDRGRRAATVPVEFHLYANGGHAFGLRRTTSAVTRWPELVETWLGTIGTTSGQGR